MLPGGSTHSPIQPRAAATDAAQGAIELELGALESQPLPATAVAGPAVGGRRGIASILPPSVARAAAGMRPAESVRAGLLANAL